MSNRYLEKWPPRPQPIPDTRQGPVVQPTGRQGAYVPGEDYTPGEDAVEYMRGSSFRDQGGMAGVGYWEWPELTQGFTEPRAAQAYTPEVPYTPEMGVLSRRWLRYAANNPGPSFPGSMAGLRGLGADEQEGFLAELRAQGVGWLSQAMTQLMNLQADYVDIRTSLERAINENRFGNAPKQAYEGMLADTLQRLQDISSLWDYLYRVRVYLFGDRYDLEQRLGGQKLQAGVLVPVLIAVVGGTILIVGMVQFRQGYEFWVKNKNDTLAELCRMNPEVCPDAANRVGSDDLLGIGKAVSSITTLLLVGGAVIGGLWLYKRFGKR